MADDLAALWPRVHVQPREERLVQDCFYYLAAHGVGRFWLLQQLQRPVEQLTASLELLFGLFQFAADGPLLGADGVDLVPELVLGPVLLSRQVKEVALLPVELGQLAGELFAYVRAEVAAGSGRGVNFRPYPSPERFGQPHGFAVVRCNQVFHDLYGDVGHVAGLVFPATAEEVEVHAAVPPLCPLHHKALLAAVAPHHALEVVGMGAVPAARAFVGVQHALYPVKQFF